LQLAAEALLAALNDAGLTPADVDGMVTYTLDSTGEFEHCVVDLYEAWALGGEPVRLQVFSMRSSQGRGDRPRTRCLHC